jgi:hypothetical protein
MHVLSEFEKKEAEASLKLIKAFEKDDDEVIDAEVVES